MSFSYSSSSSGAMSPMQTVLVSVVVVAAIAFSMLVSWKLYRKTGKPGWAAWIPIYNFLVFLDMCGRPKWWIFLLLVPALNFVIWVVLCLDLSKRFGKGIGFAIATIFFSAVTFTMLALGSAKYTPRPQTA